MYWSFYDDQPDQWPSVYDNDALTCAQKFAVAANRSAVRNIADRPFTEGFEDYARAHVWYVAISNCGGKEKKKKKK